MFQPGKNIKVLSKWDPVEYESLTELTIHDSLFQDLPCLVVHQVSCLGLDGEPQKRHGMPIRVEEDVRVRTANTVVKVGTKELKTS